MEIYRLSDDIPKEKRSGEKNSFDLVKTELTVTNIKFGVKNQERANVYINEKFAFSLDVAQVVDYKLKVGKVLTEDELADLKWASEFGKLYQRTLEWVLMRPRSTRETRDYLCRKLRKSSSDTLVPARRYGRDFAPSLLVSRERSSEDISKLYDTIIQRLTIKGYLDDGRFAEWWVENRNVRKGASQKRLRMELMQKGVSKEIIDEVLDNRDDEEEIMKIIAKKRSKYDDEKLVNYLCRHGFSFELARMKVQSYGKD